MNMSIDRLVIGNSLRLWGCSRSGRGRGRGSAILFLDQTGESVVDSLEQGGGRIASQSARLHLLAHEEANQDAEKDAQFG